MGGSKKDITGKTLQCPHCQKMFNSKPGLKGHVEKKHVDNSTAEIMSPINEESKTIDTTDQKDSNGTSFYESAREESFNSTLDENNRENMESAPVSDTEEATPETVHNFPGTEETEGSEDCPTSEANVKSYICVLCGKTSSTRQNFKIHLNRKHQEHAITDEFLESCKSSDAVPTKPFPCRYPSCQKSYSNKVSLRTHEVKDHGAAKMSGGRRRKSMDDVDSLGATLANSDAPAIPMDDLDDLLEEGRRRAEELARIKAEYYGDAKKEVSPAQIDSTANRDVNVDFKEPSQKKMKKYKPTDETEEKPVEESPVSSIDTSLSKYFEKNPNVFANARGKSLKLFSEEATGLPGGWKMRSIEREGKEGAKSTSIKHYLTPDQKVLKTGLAVLEYLRLEGKLNPDQLVEVRTVLKIPDKKLRDLNDD